MMIVFVPYYAKHTIEFEESLRNVFKVFKLIQRNRKKDGVYWTRAMIDFQKNLRAMRGMKPDDVICVMNNDISFKPELFDEPVELGEVLTAYGVIIDWKTKNFLSHNGDYVKADAFPGRCFFITYKDFLSVKFCRWLPHYLSDLDYSLNLAKRGIKIRMSKEKVSHHHTEDDPKEKKVFSIISDSNPIFWTIFLLRHFNIYAPLNILRAWYDGARLWLKG